jgi:hypothetical protein
MESAIARQVALAALVLAALSPTVIEDDNKTAIYLATDPVLQVQVQQAHHSARLAPRDYLVRHDRRAQLVVVLLAPVAH